MTGVSPTVHASVSMSLSAVPPSQPVQYGACFIEEAVTE